MANYKNDKVIKAFGEQLREIRKIKGISQENLAEETKISISQIGRIERGEVNTTISTAYLLAKSLKVNIQDLFSIL